LIGVTFQIEIITGLTFGGTSCITWGFYFPTAMEAWLWRVASPTIIGIGLISPFVDLIPENELIGPRMQLDVVIVDN